MTAPPAATTHSVFARSSRPYILWVSQQSPRALQALLGTELEVQQIQPDELDTHAHIARAVVVQVPSVETDARSTYEPLIKRALDHGLRVAFIPEDERIEAASTYLPSVKSIFDDADLRRAVTVEYGTTPALKGFLAPPPVESGCNPDLRLEGDVPSDPALQLLLRRAFNDARCISLEPMTGGKSGAHVWLVTRGREDQRHHPLPMLVKVNSRSKMQREFSSAGQAQNVIPFRMLPPLHKTRCVEGAEYGLLTYGFLEKTIPFSDALKTHDPGTLVHSLFGRTLDACMTHVEPRTGNVAEPFRALNAFRSTDALADAATEAQRAHGHLPDVASLLDQLWTLPSITYQVGYAHGDLHTGNLFVASASPEVMVIDFGSFSASQPIVTDFACLEVSVSFPSDRADDPARPETIHDELRTLYTFPAAVPAAHGGSPRGRHQHDAIRAIRRFVQQVEPQPVAYPIALAAYLVRYASYDDNACLAERALAYELAVGLIHGVQQYLQEGAGA